MTHTVQYRYIFTGVGNVLPEDVLPIIPIIVGEAIPYVLQEVALPHAPVGNKYAYVDELLYADSRYPALISAIDDHLDNVGDDIMYVSRGTYMGHTDDYNIDMTPYYYDDITIYIYRCTLA